MKISQKDIVIPEAQSGYPGSSARVDSRPEAGMTNTLLTLNYYL